MKKNVFGFLLGLSIILLQACGSDDPQMEDMPALSASVEFNIANQGEQSSTGTITAN